MKKTSILITTALVIVATAVAVVSCKKEKHDQNANGNEHFVQTADNMDEYLMSFKKKLLSAEKGGETISLEQAERDLGNLLNFDFGDANYATDVFQRDTICLKLSTTNGMVDLSQLAVTYNNAVGEIIETYGNVTLSEKSVYAVSCKFIEGESKDGEIEDVEIVLITRGQTELPFPYYATIDWKPRENTSDCYGQHWGYGGPDVMEQWILDSQEHMGCMNGGRVYFTEVGSWTIYGHETHDMETNCFGIYTSIDPCHNTNCITYEEMRYYYANILSNWHQQGFASHEIMGVRIILVHVVHGYTNTNQFVSFFDTWKVTINHAKPNCTETDPLL